MAILTEQEVLVRGLKRLKIQDYEIDRRLPGTNQLDFISHYGSPPIVIAELWRLLHMTTNDEARIDPKKDFFHDFLISLHWMKVAPTERERKIQLSVCRTTGRKWTWYYVKKISKLKEELIVWPPSFPTKFTVTVDGVHFRIMEPTHPLYKIDTGFYSHKFGGAGVDYEIAISIFEPRVLWVNGPFPSGQGDREIFKAALRAKIPRGHIALMDRGYRGGGKCVSTVNSLDSDELNEFKTRALARHENFNARLKRFKILREKFRCSHKKHGVVFDSVCCLCQLEMMFGMPVFDV